VCQESRNAVIHAYPFVFGSEDWESFVRFNFQLDTLYISRSFRYYQRWLFEMQIPEEEIKRLKYLAIDASMFEHPTWWVDPQHEDEPAKELEMYLLKQAVNRMTRLEEVIEVYLLHYWAQHIDWLHFGSQIKLCEKLPSRFEEPELDIDAKLPLAEDSEEIWEVTTKVRPIFGVTEGLATAPGAPHRETLRHCDSEYCTWVGPFSWWKVPRE
jgi:hypothetical protein